MVEIRSQDKCSQINIASSNTTRNLSIKPEAAEYYSALARAWAINEEEVIPNKYSALHYAQTAKTYADSTEQYKNEILTNNNIITIANDLNNDNFIETCANNISYIQTANENAQQSEYYAGIASQKVSEMNVLCENLLNKSLSNINSTGIATIRQCGTNWGLISGDISDQEDISDCFSGKADIDLSNCTRPYISETYQNGYSWYRAWSDGWIEQGGYIPKDSGTSGTITFVKSFTSTNYTITSNTTNNASSHSFIIGYSYNHTESSVTWYKTTSGVGGNWYACGY